MLLLTAKLSERGSRYKWCPKRVDGKELSCLPSPRVAGTGGHRQRSDRARAIGHEMIGTAEAAGADVRTLRRADVVVIPLVSAKGICIFCHEGLPTGGVYLWFFRQPGEGWRAGRRRSAFPMPTGHCSPSRSGRTTPGCLVSRAVARDPRRPHPAWTGLRPCRGSRRGARRLPGHVMIKRQSR